MEVPTTTCPNNHVVAVGMAFCPMCGLPINASQSASAQVPPPSTPPAQSREPLLKHASAGVGTWVALVFGILGTVVPVAYLGTRYASDDGFARPPVALFIILGVSATLLVVVGVTRLNLRHRIWRPVLGVLALYLLFGVTARLLGWPIAVLVLAAGIYVWIVRRRSRASGTDARELVRRDYAVARERASKAAASLKDRRVDGPNTRQGPG